MTLNSKLRATLTSSFTIMYQTAHLRQLITFQLIAQLLCKTGTPAGRPVKAALRKARSVTTNASPAKTTSSSRPTVKAASTSWIPSITTTKGNAPIKDAMSPAKAVTDLQLQEVAKWDQLTAGTMDMK